MLTAVATAPLPVCSQNAVTADEGTAASLVINEVMAANVDEFVSPAFNFDGWIELYNPTDEPVSLGGLYLSNDAQHLTKWRMPAVVGEVPARGFQVIWFDSQKIAPQNAPFKLDVDGGTIFLSHASGTLIASQDYPAARERVSYARTTDGGSTWGLTFLATPGTSNNGSPFASSQLAAPVVSQPSQLFTGSLTVSVTIPAGCTLRYTTDGSLPTLHNGSTSTTGLFTVSTTACYRFRLFADGMLASPVTTRSYIYKDRDYYLPVVSVVGDDRFLYGDEMGVLVKGCGNGRPGNGMAEPCNWNMDWERPVNFSYLTADGRMVLNQDVELEVSGGWSRAWLPHSFKLKGTKEMGGNKNLPYPFFEQKPYIRNRTLQIRNGGNENETRLKDAALGYVLQTSGMDVDVQSYQPVHEFINGQYIGVLNVREPNNKDYVYANYGLGDDEIDQFEMSCDSGYVQKCGTPASFDELVALSEGAAFSDTYAEICRRLDIDEYVNYMAVELYLGVHDWGHNNVKGYKAIDGGKFRFVFFDCDKAFQRSTPITDFLNKEWYLFNELYPVGQERIYAQIKFVTLFKNMLQSATFRRRFIDAFCMVGGSVFEAGRACAIVEMLAQRVEAAMNLEGRTVMKSVSDIKDSLNGRLALAMDYLQRCPEMGISQPPQSVTLTADVEGAQLFVNGMKVPTGQFRGYLFAPAVLKAVAPAGYEFAGWATTPGTYYSTSAEVNLPAGTVNLTACFRELSLAERTRQGIAPVCINEVSASNDSFVNDYFKKNDWVELYNTTGEELDVEGMYLSDDPARPDKYLISKEAAGANTTIAPHGYLIVWCDKLATTPQALHAPFKLGGGGGMVSLMAADKSWTDSLYYGAHDATVTVGRYPDGCDSVYVMNVATIERPNLLSSYARLTDQEALKHPTGIVALQSAAHRDCHLSYGSGMLFASGRAASDLQLEVFSADGRAVVAATLTLGPDGTARCDVSYLPAGLYVARVASGSTASVVCKFVVP